MRAGSLHRQIGYRLHQIERAADHLLLDEAEAVLLLQQLDAERLGHIKDRGGRIEPLHDAFQGEQRLGQQYQIGREDNPVLRRRRTSHEETVQGSP